MAADSVRTYRSSWGGIRRVHPGDLTPTGRRAHYRLGVADLSVDYAEVMAGLGAFPTSDAVGRALLDVLTDRYRRQHPASAVLTFTQIGATYCFDFASSDGLPQEDRTIAAWTLTPPDVDPRDTSYQRRFPLAPRGDGQTVDRGHLIPHRSGGEFGPNIFAQDRDLNRGVSAQGKRYRAIEREAASVPGTFFFGHLLYNDDSSFPAAVEIGLLREGQLHVERYDNRPRRS